MPKGEINIRLEYENWVRILTLIHYGGKDICMDIFQREGFPRSGCELYTRLHMYYPKIIRLLQRGVIKQDQYDLVYPSNRITNLDSFDISLLGFLIRILFGDVYRKMITELLKWRNRIFHKGSISLSTSEFDNLWTDILKFLKQHGFDESKVKSLRDCELDKEPKYCHSKDETEKLIEEEVDVQFIKLAEHSPHNANADEFKKGYIENRKNFTNYKGFIYKSKRPKYKLGKHSVYLGYDSRSNEWVAVKKCRYNFIDDKDIPSEISIMQDIWMSKDPHKNIASFLGDYCDYDNDDYYIFVSLYDYTLNTFLETRRQCTEEINHQCYVSLSIQLLEGLKYLHSENIVHRDLKPNNILIDLSHEQPSLKLVDFGISRRVPPDGTHSTAAAGNPSWSIPGAMFESNESYVKQVDDVFSALMLMVYTLSSGNHPFISSYTEDSGGSFTLENSKVIRNGIQLYHSMKTLFNEYFQTFNGYYQKRHECRTKKTLSDQKKREIYQRFFKLDAEKIMEDGTIRKELLVSQLLLDFKNIYCVKYPKSTLGRRYSVALPCDSTIIQGIGSAATHTTHLKQLGFQPIELKSDWSSTDILNHTTEKVSNDLNEHNFSEDVFIFFYFQGHGSYDKDSEDTCIILKKQNIWLKQFLAEFRSKCTCMVYFILVLECCQLPKKNGGSKQGHIDNTLILHSSKPGTITNYDTHRYHPSQFSKEIEECTKPELKLKDVFEKVKTVLRDKNKDKIKAHNCSETTCRNDKDIEKNHKEDCYPIVKCNSSKLENFIL